MHAVFGLCLTPLLTVFQVYRGCGQFMERGNQNARIKTAKPLVSFIIKLYQAHLVNSGNRTHNFTLQWRCVLISYLDAHASNYHTIAVAPL